MSQPSSTPVPVQLQALLNRLQARLGGGLAEAAATLLAVAEAAPNHLNREWQLFWEEVELEAERLATADQPGAGTSPEPAAADLQQQIDSLRAQVAALGQKLDA